MADDVRLQIPSEAAGQRLDRFLAEQPAFGSRSRAKQAIDSGKVSLDGRRLGPGDGGRALREGAVVEIAWSRPGTSARRTRGKTQLHAAGVRVLYDDVCMVVVDKPAGLLTDAATRQQQRDRDTLRKRVRSFCGGGQAYPAHRIDRDTTGVVAFAKDEATRDVLRAQWQAERRPDRVYLAVVEGDLKGTSGVWTDWMAWDARGRIQRRCDPEAERGVLAEANWKLLERFGTQASLIEVRLVTGRRNQIRLHASLRGHPVVGDTLYRPTGRAVTLRYGGQALHARSLTLDHPKDRRRLTFEAAPPSAFEQLLRFLRSTG